VLVQVLVVLYTTGLRLQIFLNERRKKREARRAEALGRFGQNIKMAVMAPNYATGQKTDKSGILNALRVLAGHRAPKPVRDPECANEFGLKPGMNVDNESLMLREVRDALANRTHQPSLRAVDRAPAQAEDTSQPSPCVDPHRNVNDDVAGVAPTRRDQQTDRTLPEPDRECRGQRAAQLGHEDSWEDDQPGVDGRRTLCTRGTDELAARRRDRE
jgi:hypothetical protein